MIYLAAAILVGLAIPMMTLAIAEIVAQARVTDRDVIGERQP